MDCCCFQSTVLFHCSEQNANSAIREVSNKITSSDIVHSCWYVHIVFTCFAVFTFLGLCYLFFQLTVEYEWKNWNSFVTKEIMKPKRYLSSRFSPEYRLGRRSVTRISLECFPGNHIMELVGVYGISRTLNRTPTFWIENEGYRKMLEDVKVILPGLVDQYTVFEGKVCLISEWPDNKKVSFAASISCKNNTVP